MLNRISVPALAAVALLLVACPKKAPDATPEAGAAPTPDTATPVVTTTATTATPLAPGPKPVAKAVDAGGADSGAAAGDAGTVAATADAGAAPQTCCCKVGDAYSNGITQSSCAGTMKGACVAKDECTKRECCCEAGGKKSIAMQSECSKTMKGKCVGKDQCK